MIVWFRWQIDYGTSNGHFLNFDLSKSISPLGAVASQTSLRFGGIVAAFEPVLRQNSFTSGFNNLENGM